MLPKLYFVLVLLLVSLKSGVGHISIKNYGTYIISCIVKQGIVLAADSREVCFNHDEVYTYCEGVQKIFEYKGVYLQVSGGYEFGKYTIYGLVNKFEQENRNYIDVTNFFSIFSNFVKSKISNAEYAEFHKNQWIISGFYNSVPHIYLITNKGIDSAIGSGFETNRHSDEWGTKFTNFLNTADPNQAAVFEKNIIENTAKQDKDRMSKIGGPISIVYFDAGGEKHADIQKKYQYLTTRENEIANFNGLIIRVYRSKKDSILYKKALKDAIEHH